MPLMKRQAAAGPAIRIVAPSAIPMEQGWLMPHELGDADLKNLREDWRLATLRAVTSVLAGPLPRKVASEVCAQTMPGEASTDAMAAPRMERGKYFMNTPSRVRRVQSS